MESLLSTLDDAANTVLNAGLSSLSTTGLVATTGKNLSVVRGTTTIPGQKLKKTSVQVGLLQIREGNLRWGCQREHQ